MRVLLRTARAQAKKADAANRPPVAAVDTAGTESEDLELGHATGGVLARGRGRGTGSRIKARAVRLKTHEVRRPAPRLVATEQRGK